MPKSLFYEFASPALLQRPAGVPSWDSHGEGWEGAKVDTELTFDDFRRRLDASPEIERLFTLAARFGDPGVRLVLSHFERRMRAHLK